MDNLRLLFLIDQQLNQTKMGKNNKQEGSRRWFLSLFTTANKKVEDTDMVNAYSRWQIGGSGAIRF